MDEAVDDEQLEHAEDERQPRDAQVAVLQAHPEALLLRRFDRLLGQRTFWK